MFPKKLNKQPVCNGDEPVAKTGAGKICGRFVENTYIFRGIKYAEAKRFQMPEEVKPWEGVKEAIVYGPVCCEMSNTIPYDETLVPHYFYPQDEDCQYLNIWTQHLDAKAKKPVMVWIHGGAFISGSSCEQFAYDGENLSKNQDVVVVSLNHRLNVLGFFDLSDYGEKYKHSGNVGMADIVTALKWIRDNIAAFGGDPGNITLLGHSGGGGKLTTLLQMPAADGLFHKAVLFSGVINNKKDVTPEQSRKLTEMTIEELGISRGNIEEIERVPYFRLARAVTEAAGKLMPGQSMAFVLGPVRDGEYYAGHPLEVGFREESKHIPLIVGSVLAEFGHNYGVVLAEGSKNTWDEGLKQKLMNELYGEYAGRILEAFKKAYPGRNTVDALYVDKIMRKGNIDFTRLRANSGCADVYGFVFCLESPFNSGTAPWHGSELPYVFYNAECMPTSFIPGVTEKLQDMIGGACASFARTGNPNADGMPEWRPMEKDRDVTMIFDRESELRYDHDSKLIGIIPDASIGKIMGRRPKPVLGGGPRQSL